MDFLYLKALHIIFIVTWFSGLFYMVRLFIYFKEAEQKDEVTQKILQDQYKLMAKRLWYIITWPSAILASAFAFWMLYKTPEYLTQGWMHIKLTFVLALYFYHGACHTIYKKMTKGNLKNSSFFLRIWNEVSTLILFATVFLVVLKDTINWIWGLAGLITLSIVLMIGVKFYKKRRDQKGWHSETEDKKPSSKP